MTQDKKICPMGRKRLFVETKGLDNNDLGIKITTPDVDTFSNTLEITLDLPEGSIFHKHPLYAKMVFPYNYPYDPPTFVFVSNVYHPNVYPDGKVCISILHTENDAILDNDIQNCTWTPGWGVRTVCLAVISVLDEPNIKSPANVDASLDYRDNKEEYIKKVKSCLKSNRTGSN